MDMRDVSCKVGKWKGLRILPIGRCYITTVEPLCSVDSGPAYCSGLLSGAGITAAEPLSCANRVTAYCCCIEVILWVQTACSSVKIITQAGRVQALDFIRNCLCTGCRRVPIYIYIYMCGPNFAYSAVCWLGIAYRLSAVVQT